MLPVMSLLQMYIFPKHTGSPSFMNDVRKEKSTRDVVWFGLILMTLKKPQQNPKQIKEKR